MSLACVPRFETLLLINIENRGFRYWGRNSSKNDFYPITKLNRSDGDGVLFSFQSGMIPSATPIDDPMFSAHKKESPFWDTTNSTYYYFADDIATVIGCFEQVRAARIFWLYSIY